MTGVGAALKRGAALIFLLAAEIGVGAGVGAGIGAGPAMAQPVPDGGWFTHPFGEARSYHRDWLAVCDGDACRVVHYVFAPDDTSFFGSARVAVHLVDGGYAVEIWDKAAAMTPRVPLDLRFDGARVALDASWAVAGGHDGLNVAQTLSVAEPTLAAALVALMRVADRLDMTLDGSRRRVSLLGFGAALDAIALYKD
ncbi:MAG: hypothetical protein ACPGFC_00545 [Paracoccaceae bacterium]